MTKVCTICGMEKELTEFSPRKDSKCGYRSACKMCHNGRSHRNKGYKKYHITKVEYDKLLESQAGVCAICETTGSSRGLCVDHCHDTGAIRGILCHHCNLKLTRPKYPTFVEDFEERASRYLAKG